MKVPRTLEMSCSANHEENPTHPTFQRPGGFVEAEDIVANSPLNKMMEEQRGSGKSFIKGGHCRALSHTVIKYEATESTTNE